MHTTKLYTVGKAIKAVRERTGIELSKTTVYRQAALGKLPGARLNGRIYIDVDAYVADIEDLKAAVAKKLDQFSQAEVNEYLGAA